MSRQAPKASQARLALRVIEATNGIDSVRDMSTAALRHTAVRLLDAALSHPDYFDEEEYALRLKYPLITTRPEGDQDGGDCGG